MTNSACPSTRLMTACTRSSTSRWAGVCTSSSRLPSPADRVRRSRRSASRSRCQSADGSRSLAATNAASSPWTWSRSQGWAVNWIRWVSSCRQTQSRKSCGSTPSACSDGHDVGGDQQQPARGAGAVGAGRDEELVLAEDPAGQVGQQRPDLHAGHAAADRPGHAGGQAAARGDRAHDRRHHLPEGRDVAPHPGRPVHHGGRRDVGRRVQPGEGQHVVLGLVGERAQVRDHGRRLLPAHLGAGLDQPVRGPDREVPVDQVARVGRHPARVRGRRHRRPAAAAAGCRGPPGHRAGGVSDSRSRPAPRRPRPARAARRRTAAGHRTGVEGEGQQAPVGVDHQPGERADAGQGAGLRPYPAGCGDVAGGRGGPEPVAERAGEAGDRQPGDDRSQVRPGRVGGQPEHRDDRLRRQPVVPGQPAAVDQPQTGGGYARGDGRGLHGGGGAGEGGRLPGRDRHRPGQRLGQVVVAGPQHLLDQRRRPVATPPAPARPRRQRARPRPDLRTAAAAPAAREQAGQRGPAPPGPGRRPGPAGPAGASAVHATAR